MRHPNEEPSLALVFAGLGEANGKEPAAAPAPRDPVSESFAWNGQSAGAGVAWDPDIERLFRETAPIERKYTVTWDFDAGVDTTPILARTLQLNDFPFLQTQIRWEWSGAALSPQFTPIEVQYGSSSDQVIGRDAKKDDRELTLITAVWGRMNDWVFPARPKLWRANRFLTFWARLDYTLIPSFSDTPPLTRLDLVIDGLECRPREG